MAGERFSQSLGDQNRSSQMGVFGMLLDVLQHDVNDLPVFHLGQMLEQQNGSTYTQMLHSQVGKTAIMNGQTLTKAFINLPGGGTAKSGSVRHRRRLGLFDRNIGGYRVGLDDPRYVDHALEGVHVAITPR
jgi:hypothetical protein